MNYNQQTYSGVGTDTRVSAVMKRVYLTMTIGLAFTGVIAYFCGNSYAYLQFLAQNSWMLWALFIAEIGIVLGVSAGINRLSSGVATLLFIAFAALNGMSLAPIFVVYTDVLIAKTFFITAGVFGAMTIYGFCTNRDLTRIGSFLFMALIGLIIASVVNMFLHSKGFEFIISIAGVLIFVGLTAWDTQQMKRIALTAPDDSLGRLAVLGALNLYLDFINLFLYLLRFFGNSND